MTRLIMFATFIVVFTFLALNSIGDLPERIATHFETNGAADGWTSQESYRLFILLFLIGLPSLLVWLMAGLPRLTKGRGQIPNCEYWFAQERRQITEKFLIDHGCWLGILTVAVVYGLHLLILRANAATPPVLAMDRFGTMIGLYLCGLIWWTATFLRHFQKVEMNN